MADSEWIFIRASLLPVILSWGIIRCGTEKLTADFYPTDERRGGLSTDEADEDCL